MENPNKTCYFEELTWCEEVAECEEADFDDDYIPPCVESENVDSRFCIEECKNDFCGCKSEIAKHMK